jgi:hypothetical protein|tara:strand:+ start:86 stop:502 length:417 start_codon:yes stop_codon:yes gene_type:complete
MNFDDLRSKAFDTAKLWATCDEALAQVDEAFGTPWQASRDTLNTSLSIADTKGIELEQFQGPDSPFRFPEIGTQVIVRISRLPVPCDELAKIDIRIEKAERELKLLKSKRKSLIEQLKIKGLEFVTEKVTTAYKRISK